MIYNLLSFSLVVSRFAAATTVCSYPIRSDNADLVAVLGSSYSAGPGLIKNAGAILADMFAEDAGLSQPFDNYANCSKSSTDVTDVPNHAKLLGGLKYKAIMITSGGNDLNYVSCLITPTQENCGNTIDESTFITRYTAALDSIRDNTSQDTPIFIITYIQAIGPQTMCNCNVNPCDLCPNQATVSEATYTKTVNWTVDAYNTWKSNNSGRSITLVPMRQYSSSSPVKHYVGQNSPWISGSTPPAPGDGETWHPNKAGHTFIANAVFNLTKGLPIVPQ